MTDNNETATCEGPLCESVDVMSVENVTSGLKMIVCFDHYCDFFYPDGYEWVKDNEVLRAKFNNLKQVEVFEIPKRR